MQRWSLLLAGLVLSVAQPGLAAPVGLSDFFGSWRGAELDASGAEGLKPSHLDVVIAPEEDGFRMRWTRLANADGKLVAKPAEASFEATGRPGVFAFKQAEGSLLQRFFAAPATGNPLEGETLLWARMEGPALIVYSLSLDQDGGFDLDRIARTFTDGALSHEQTLRTEAGRVATIKGELRQSGS